MATGLYSDKEKRCPAYSKKYFSRGILSSQRSETTNKSVSRRLHKTQGLCDFYREFLDVADKWRSKESGEDYQCKVGNRHLAFASVKLLIHAKELYTIELYLMFEDNFIKGAACNHKIVSYEPPILVYHVWRLDQDFIRHVVTFNLEENIVDFTCKGFTESELLCAHSLRIFHIHCVETVPPSYLVSRWTKAVMYTSVDDDATNEAKDVSPCVWRTHTIRNFIRIVNSSQNDVVSRKVVDSAYDDMKKEVENLIGSIDLSEEPEHEESSTPSADYVKNPTKRKEKYVRNDRLKSTMEKQCNKVKGWKKRQAKFSDKTKAKAQASVQGENEIPPGGNLFHLMSHDLGLEVFVPDDYFGVNYIPFTSS
ncbi:protein FAR1-RELATED SEQUENCE 5-like [Spinacia oleracea]|uniref:Protein FAR1-RELATED SEQUENCE 5-like n=1 Tax=Spinacia oleracea TaxID=3562 RepID=A0A9R0JQP1_SPIOL|nr:protein FAR1-RELATED SEQUENCE 5-like [Spinacia oleracea]